MAKDPYRYFRIEARELLLGLGEGLLALEAGPSAETAGRLLRQAHTLKGAARVVKLPAIGDLAHAIEELLSPYRDGREGVPRSTIDEALAAVDVIQAQLARLDEPAPAPGGPAPGGETPTIELKPLGAGALDDVERLLERVEDAAGAVARARRAADALGEAAREARELIAEALAGRDVTARGEALGRLLDAAVRTIGDANARATGELEALRQATADLRLVPARGLVAQLERAVRDAAQSAGRSVAFRAVGADTRLDAQVIPRLWTALLHLVRNAVAHGIEPEAERVAAGKPPVGTVEITLARRGHRVQVTCRDDGRGLDVEAVRRVAVDRGVASPEALAASSVGELAALLLRGGLSTSGAVTDLAGRGVGLDAVRQAILELRGQVDFASEPGRGTTVTLGVPVSLTWVPALALHVAADTVYVPVESVRRTLHAGPDAVIAVPEGRRVVVDGASLPYLELRHALGSPPGAPGGARTVVVMAANEQQVALAVDGLGGVRDIVVRRIPARARVSPLVTGATLDGDGVAELLLSPSGLVAMAVDHAWRPPPPRRPAPPMLIVDDSLTTRILEQSILESAGYRVDLAVSGEDALEKARARRYGLYLVDVEMPGMSGFEFIAATRSDPALRDVPSILVSSRASAEDKRRGREVGAEAYVVKGEFDQEALLATIRRLVGAP